MIQTTTRKKLLKIRFSALFFASGTRFLVTNGNAAKVNLENGLEGIQTGVLPETTTDQFLQETYPQAAVVYFEGKQERKELQQLPTAAWMPLSVRVFCDREKSSDRVNFWYRSFTSAWWLTTIDWKFSRSEVSGIS